MRGHNAKPTFN